MAVAAPKKRIKKTDRSPFAIRLRKFLEEREWSQDRLAREAGLTHAAIRKLVMIEGGATPSLRTAQKIARALGVSVADFPDES